MLSHKTPNRQPILNRKSNARGIPISDFESYHNATLTNTAWYRLKNGYTD